MEHNTATMDLFNRFIVPCYWIIRPLINPHSVSGLIIWDEKAYESRREQALSELKRLVHENKDVVGSLTYEQVQMLDFRRDDADKEFRRLCTVFVQMYLDYRVAFDEIDRRMKGMSRLRYAIERVRLPKGHGLSTALCVKRGALLIGDALEPVLKGLVAVLAVATIWIMV